MANALTTDALPKLTCQNILSIPEISIEDLDGAEQDLCTYEKISLLFLLTEKDNVHYILQQLSIIVQQDNSIDGNSTSFLSNWARTHRNEDLWKKKLLEALCIIKAHHVIEKFGLDVNDLRERYLPNNALVTLFLHPIIKRLYILCESLNMEYCNKLILHMKLKFDAARLFCTHYEKYLEIHILEWIISNIISIGDAEGNGCYLKPLITYMKSNEIHNLEDMLAQSPINNENMAFNIVSLVNDAVPFIISNYDIEPSTGPKNISANYSEDNYKISGNDPGYILIINQKNFHRETDANLLYLLPNKKLETRDGTDEDVKSLERTFMSFGFISIVKNNLSHSEILLNVENIVKMMHSRCSALFVCILSHGNEGCVYGANSIPVEVKDIKNEMIKIVGKPKVLIIQACQGNVLQNARQISYLAEDGPENTAPMVSDLLVAWSTVEGFASIRHKENGSWFIQTICEKINEHYKSHHLIDILTKVTKDVSDKRGDKKQCMMPKMETYFRKFFYFPDKIC